MLQLSEARNDLDAWLNKWSTRYSRLTEWFEENIEETFTFDRLPRLHYKHMKSTEEMDKSLRAKLCYSARARTMLLQTEDQSSHERRTNLQILTHTTLSRFGSGENYNSSYMIS